MQNYSDQYRPDNLALMTTGKCNAECRHCGVSASPKNSNHMTTEMGLEIINKAGENGQIQMVSMCGGDPFLRWKNGLRDLIEATVLAGMNVNIDTNGFWGRSEDSVREKLKFIRDAAGANNKLAMLSISLDQYHAEHIPIQSIVNIIKIYFRECFENIMIGLYGMADKEGMEVFESFFRKLNKASVDFQIDVNNSVMVLKNGKPIVLALRESLNNIGRARDLTGVPKVSSQEAILSDIGESIVVDQAGLAYVDVDAMDPSANLGQGVSLKGKSFQDVFPKIQQQVEQAFGRKLRYICNS